MSNIVVFVGLVISTGFLVRNILIVAGFLKDPILRSFERYGDEESFYFVLPAFLMWLGLFVMSLSLIFGYIFGGWTSLGVFIALLLLGAAALTHRFRGYAWTHPHPLWIYPYWLYELQGRTTRLERRRMAYMWLRLSWRAKLAYNSSTPAFIEWADMIILSTLM